MGQTCCRKNVTESEKEFEESDGRLPPASIIDLSKRSMGITRSIVKLQSLVRGHIARQMSKEIVEKAYKKGRNVHAARTSGQTEKTQDTTPSPIKIGRTAEEEEEEEVEKEVKGGLPPIEQGIDVVYDENGIGRGTFKWEDGSSYTGEFKNNSIHGFGVYSWADGRKYEGTWFSNKMQGRGVFSWKDGRIYDGDYANDKKHGEGTFTWPDGKKYVGQWKNGLQTGEGLFISSKGRQRMGNWERGKLLKWV